MQAFFSIDNCTKINTIFLCKMIELPPRILCGEGAPCNFCPYTISSGLNTSSKRSGVKKPSFVQASFREMFSL